MKRSKAGTQWFLTYRDLGPPSLRKGQGRDKSREKERKRKPRPDWDETIHDLSQYKLTEEEIEERKKAATSKNAVHIPRSDVENWVPQLGYDERGRFHNYIVQPRLVSEDSFQGGRRHHEKPQPWRPGGTPNFLEHLDRSPLRRPITARQVDNDENESEMQARDRSNGVEKDGRSGRVGSGELGRGENTPRVLGVNGVVDFDEEVSRFEAKQRLIESLQKRQKPDASSEVPLHFGDDQKGRSAEGDAVLGSEVLGVRRSGSTRRDRGGRIDEGQLAGLEKGFADLEAKVSQAAEAKSRVVGGLSSGQSDRRKKGESVSWQDDESVRGLGDENQIGAQDWVNHGSSEAGHPAAGFGEVSGAVSANEAAEGQGSGRTNGGYGLPGSHEAAADGTDGQDTSPEGLSEQRGRLGKDGAPAVGDVGVAQTDGFERPVSEGAQRDDPQSREDGSTAGLQGDVEIVRSREGLASDGSRPRDGTGEGMAIAAETEARDPPRKGAENPLEEPTALESRGVYPPMTSQSQQPVSNISDGGVAISERTPGGGPDDPGETTGRGQPGGRPEKVPGRTPAVVERTAPGGTGTGALTSVSAVDAMAHLDRLSQGLQTCLAENQSLKSDFAEYKAHASTILTGLQLHVQKLLDLMPANCGHVAPSPFPAVDASGHQSGSTQRGRNPSASEASAGTFELKLPTMDEDLVDSIPLPSYAELRASSPQKRPIVQRHVRRSDGVRASTGLEPVPRSLPAMLRTSLRSSHASR